MFAKRSILTLALAASAAIAASMFVGTAPAEAGRKTGTWKYSPEEVYAAQRAQRRSTYGARRGYGRGDEQGYGQGYDRSYGSSRGGYDRGYGSNRGGYAPAPRPYIDPNSAAPIAGPGGGGPGTYGRP